LIARIIDFDYLSRSQSFEVCEYYRFAHSRSIFRLTNFIEFKIKLQLTFDYNNTVIE